MKNRFFFLLLASLLFCAGYAQNCENFNNNVGNWPSVGSWQAQHASIVNGVPYLKATDGPSTSPSWIYNEVNYTGDLGASATCLCWDYVVLDDGVPNSSSAMYPKIRIYQGTISNQTLWAEYVSNSTITENDNWVTICTAPIRYAQNTLPFDSNGEWRMSAGSTLADWNALVSNVSGVAFNTDVAGSPTQNEVLGVDDFCKQNCCNQNASPSFSLNTNCNNGNFSVTVAANDPTAGYHWWGLMETTVEGSILDADTVDGDPSTLDIDPVSPIQYGSSATFNWLDQSKSYYIKHGIWDNCYTWKEVRTPVQEFDATVAFNFENESGTIKNTFCYGEDVYLDGAASQGEDSYYIDIWRRVTGSAQGFNIYATLGWTSTQVGLVNLSEEIANLNPSKYFELGYEYEIKLALANSQNCIDWTALTHNFTLECCNSYFEAEFASSQDTNGNIEIIGFNSYENVNVTHQWYVFSSSNPGTGPYSVVYNATSALVAPFTFNFTTQPEKYYTIIHKVTTPCEEVCYTTEHYFNKSGKGAKLEKASNSNLDCSVIDDILCEISAPGNLQAVGGNTLTWDPVPGAVSYVITSSSDPQGPDCGCEEVYVEPMTTTTNSYVMTGELMNSCFAWQVTAICASGNKSLISRASCYNPNNQVTCSTIPPTNLQVIGTTLSWNPVPGAVSYTVHSPSGNTTPIDCGCKGGGVSIIPIITTTNSYALPSGMVNQCFVWQVTANCANGDRRSPSQQACYPEVENKNDGNSKEKISIYPNPNKGVMDIKIEIEGDKDIVFNIYTFDGVLVKTINNNTTVNGVLKLNVDLRRQLTKGLYFFTFNTGKQTITKKVMIE